MLLGSRLFARPLRAGALFRRALLWNLFVLLWLPGNSSGQTSTYFPLAAGDAWTLTNQWVPQPLVVGVSADQVSGSLRRVTLQFNHPYMAFSFLLNPSAAGIAMEGYLFPPATYRFAEPADFLKDAADGQSWTSALGRVTLVASNLTVDTPAGSFTSCRRYQVAANGQVTDWYLAPNVGLVQFGSGLGAFKLSTFTLKTYSPRTPVPVPATCPQLGIEVDPAGLNTTYANGTRFAHVNATWWEMERSQGAYNFGKIDSWVQAATKQKVDLAFTVRVIDTVRLDLPDDLAGRKMDDPVVLQRFGSFIRALTARFGGRVKWLHIGNEIDTYLAFQPADAIPAFRKLYSTGVAAARGINSSLSIGTVFAYPTTRRNDSIFQSVNSLMDHVAFTYYPLNDNYLQRDAAVASTDIADMVRLAGSRKLVLTEVGYASSAAANGSETGQAAFYKAVLSALQTNSGVVSAANFFTLLDPPASSVDSAAAYYGTQGRADFKGFLGSLGLVTTAGQVKPAWGIWRTSALQFAANLQCTQQP